MFMFIHVRKCSQIIHCACNWVQIKNVTILIIKLSKILENVSIQTTKLGHIIFKKFTKMNIRGDGNSFPNWGFAPKGKRTRKETFPSFLIVDIN